MGGQEQRVGDNSVAIQVAANHVIIAVGTASLTLARRHRLKARPRNERELLITEIRGTDLVGRDADLAALNAWLRAPHDLPAVRCLTGRAGAGKTRLAIELCEQAEVAGWTAGFATQPELQRFHDAQPGGLALGQVDPDRRRLRGGLGPCAAGVAGGAGPAPDFAG